MIGLALLTFMLAATGAVRTHDPIHAHGSPSAGEAVRAIKSLSPEDVAEKVAAIQDLLATMEAGPITEGERLIVLEQELDEQFRQRTITELRLRDLMAEITATRGQLRYVRLAARLAKSCILTQAQIDRYSELRGIGTPAMLAPLRYRIRPWGTGTTGVRSPRPSSRPVPSRCPRSDSPRTGAWWRSVGNPPWHLGSRGRTWGQ